MKCYENSVMDARGIVRGFVIETAFHTHTYLKRMREARNAEHDKRHTATVHIVSASRTPSFSTRIFMTNPFLVKLRSITLPFSLVFEEATLTPQESHRTAYDRARHIERLDQWPTLPPPSAIASAVHMKWPENLKPKTAGRLFGYMLIEAYNENGADAIAREINSCGSEESQEHVDYYFADLARFYFMALLKPCTSTSLCLA